MALPEMEGKSTLEELSIKRFGGRTFQQERVTAVGTSRVTLLQNDPNRVFFSVINESANDVRVSHDHGLTVTSGWLLAANGGIVSMFWEEDGEAVGQELFAIATAAGSNVRSSETVIV